MTKLTLKEMGISHTPSQTNEGFLTPSASNFPIPETISEYVERRDYLKSYQMGLIVFYNSDDIHRYTQHKMDTVFAEITETEKRINKLNRLIEL